MWSLCVHQLSKHILIPLQIALTVAFPWLGCQGGWLLKTQVTTEGFFHLLSIQTTGSFVNLSPARSLHELKVFGSHKVL